MPRRMLTLLAAVAIVIAACSNGPAATPVPTDPAAILAATTASLHDVKSVHYKVAVTGSLNTGGLLGGDSASSGPSGSGSSLDLAGTTIEGDLDVVNSAATVTATVPALLNLTANVIVVGGVAYIKTSLTGAQYEKLDTSSLTGALPIPSTAVGGSPAPEASAVLSEVQAALAKLPPPTLLADETVNGQDCHHIQVKVASSDVPMASGALDGVSGSATVDVWSQKSDGRPSRLVIAVDGASQGTLSLTIDLTNYDAAVTIAAPPADQISDQPFTIPGLGQ